MDLNGHFPLHSVLIVPRGKLPFFIAPGIRHLKGYIIKICFQKYRLDVSFVVLKNTAVHCGGNSSRRKFRIRHQLISGHMLQPYSLKFFLNYKKLATLPTKVCIGKKQSKFSKNCFQ